MATYQEIIRAWWANARGTYKLVALVLVTVEDSAGDPDAAALRVAMLEGVSLLDATMEVEELSKSLIKNNVIPRQAAGDVTHIAIAATSGVDYFVTWNFRHIANAAMRARIEDICRQAGYDPVVICTPNKLMDADHD